MKQRPFLKKHKAFTVWFVSYAVILAQTLLAAAGIYCAVAHTVEEAVTRTNDGIMLQLRNSMDDYLSTMQKLLVELDLDADINQLYKRPLTKEELAIESMSAMTKLNNSRYIYRSIGNFYIYLKDYDYIIYTNFCADTETAYRILYPNAEWSYDEWMDYLNQRHQRSYRALVLDREQNGATMAMAQSLPIDNLSSPKATLVFQADANMLRKFMQGLEQNEGSMIYYLNGNQQPVFSNTNIPMPDLEPFELEEPHLTIRSEGEKYVMSMMESSLGDLKYVSIVPQNTYDYPLRTLRYITIGILILAFVSGTLLISYFVKRNYKPLKELMELAEADIDEENTNEFDVIRSSISRTVNEKKKLENRLEKQKYYVKNNFLEKLLHGRADRDLQPDSLFAYGVDFQYSYFVVIAFYLEQFEALFEGSEMATEAQIDLAFLMIQNVAEELAEEVGDMEFARTDDLLVGILNCEEASGVVEQIAAILEKAHDKLEESIYISFKAGISRVHSSLVGLSLAYQEASEALDRKFVQSGDTIICYDDLQYDQSSFEYSIEDEQLLMNQIKLGDYEQAKLIVDRVLKINLQERSLKTGAVRLLLLGIANTVIRASDGQINEMAATELFNSVNDMNRYREKLDTLLWTTCKQIEQDRQKQREQSGTNRISNAVKDYISQNYGNVNLNLNVLAGELGITSGYLSGAFRLQTGETLLHYLNKVRIEEAKRLLTETEWNLQKIAKRVGYIDSHALIRSFKKQVGITPGKYRDMKRVINRNGE